jgi:hypothetical protein
MRAAKAKRTNASGEVRPDAELLGAVVEVLDPVALVVVDALVVAVRN